MIPKLIKSCEILIVKEISINAAADMIPPKQHTNLPDIRCSNNEANVDTYQA